MVRRRGGVGEKVGRHDGLRMEGREGVSPSSSEHEEEIESCTRVKTFGLDVALSSDEEEEKEKGGKTDVVAADNDARSHLSALLLLPRRYEPASRPVCGSSLSSLRSKTGSSGRLLRLLLYRLLLGS